MKQTCSGSKSNSAQILLDRFALVLRSLSQKVDVQLDSPIADDRRVASGHDPERIAGLLPKLDSHSVACMKVFDFHALVSIRKSPIGQNAIDIGEDQFNRFANFREWHCVNCCLVQALLAASRVRRFVDL